ncbi:hypothetical protein ACHWQZ_G009214 [Mnemiopsis leidyi]
MDNRLRPLDLPVKMAAEFDPYGVTQAYTHHSVLTLGAEILTKTIDHEEHERQRAIEEAVERTRIAGEEAKAIALDKLSRKCAKAQRQALEDLQGRCDLAQEEAVKRNTEEWQQNLDTAVKFEKDYSDRRLEENLARVAKSAAADQEQAVAEARVEEKEIAKQQWEDLRQLKEQEQEEAIAKLKDEHRSAMAELESRLKVEKDREVSAAIAKTEQEALDRLTKVKIDHDNEISKYKAAIAKEQEHTDEVKLKLEQETHSKVLAEDRLKDVKEEFKYFINSLPGHENSSYNAEYMIAR